MTRSVIGKGDNKAIVESFLSYCVKNRKERLLLEWDYWKNSKIPAEIEFSEKVKNAKQVYYWKCFSCGREWTATAYDRVRNGRGCRSCAARNAMERRMKAKYGMVSDHKADYLEEWNYEKNMTLPENTVWQPTLRLWWKCKKCGYEWQTALINRESGHGCLKCASTLREKSRYATTIRTHGSLKDKDPDFLTEWDSEKNDGLYPDMITSKSHKKVWWKCGECGNSWETAISNRMQGAGCPECGKKKMISERIKNKLKTSDSLAVSNPEIAKEWDYKNNKEKTPYTVMPQSNQQFWWKCSKGHIYKNSVANKQRGSGCPYCSGHKVLCGFNDLATVRPDLTKEWNYEKNKDITPQDITAHSGKKVWWKCSEGHEWQAVIRNRFDGNNCPYCSGKCVLKGYNDLATVRPDLLYRWDYENNTFLPQELSAGSEKKVWWICPDCGYKYKAAIYTITKKNTSGCSRCAKETQTSFPEQAIYYYINKLFPNAVSGDRIQIFPKELDIYIPEIKVAIEYDGELYHQSKTKDIEKNRLCNEKGIFLYRIRELGCPILNDEENVSCYSYDRHNLNELADVIRNICIRLKRSIDIDFDRDGGFIQEQYRKKRKENSLANKYPELIEEWDQDKNGGLTPDKLSFGSGQKVWWKCKLGHSYLSAISSRTSGEQGCPYCANKKVLTGFNDVLSQYPEVAKEWCYEKNQHRPENIVMGSHQKVWWKCKSCGNTWSASVVNRIRGTWCPKCKTHRIKDTRKKNELLIKGSLKDSYPGLFKEWDYKKNNNNNNPEGIPASGNKKYWWICQKCGYQWNARLYNRMQGHGCPSCAHKDIPLIRVKKQILEEGSLADIFPDMAKEWHSIKNGSLKPTEVLSGSNKKVWWQCAKGHEWQAVIYSRTSQKSGCPFCSGKRVYKGFNDLATKNPDIAKEWNHTRNNGLQPSDVTSGSSKKVWWKCSEGHEWQAIVYSRTSKSRRGCPYCSKRRKMI